MNRHSESSGIRTHGWAGVSFRRPSFSAFLAVLCVFAGMTATAQLFKDNPFQSTFDQPLTPTEHLDLVSENVGLLIQVKSMKTMQEHIKQLDVYSLKMEPDVDDLLQEIFDHVHNRFVGKTAGMSGKADKNVARLQEEWDLARRILTSITGKLTISVGLGIDHPGSLVIIGEIDNRDKKFDINERMEEYRQAVKELDPAGYQTSERPFRVKVGTELKSYDIFYLTNSQMRTTEAYTFVGNAFVYTRGEGAIEYVLKLMENDASMFSLSDNKKLLNQAGIIGNKAAGQLTDIVAYIAPDILYNSDTKESNADKLRRFRSRFGNAKKLAAGFYFDSVTGKVLEKFVVDNPDKSGKSDAFGIFSALGGRITATSMVPSFFNTNTAFMFTWSGKGRLWWYYLDNIQKNNPASGRKVREKMISAVKGVRKDPYVTFDCFKGEHGIGLIWVPGLDFIHNFQPVVILEFDSKYKWPANPTGVNPILEQVSDIIMLLVGRDISYTEEPYFGMSIFSQPPVDFPDSEKDIGFPVIYQMLKNVTTPVSKLGRNGQHFFPVYALVHVTSHDAANMEPRNFLVGGWSKKAVKRAVRQLAFPRNLKNSPDYQQTVQAMLKDNPAAKAGVYVDLSKFVEVFFYSLLPNEKIGRKLIQNIGPDFYEKIRDLIPSPKILNKYLGGIGGIASLDTENTDDNLVLNTRSPVGVLATLELYHYLTREDSENVNEGEAEKARFKKIYAALSLYATDQNAYPMYLSELLNPSMEYLMKRLSEREKRLWRYMSADERAQRAKEWRFELMDNPLIPGRQVQKLSDVDDPKKTNIVYVPNHPTPELRRPVELYGLDDQLVLYQWRSNRKDGLLYYLQRDGKIGLTNKEGILRRIKGKVDFSLIMMDKKRK